MSKKPKYRVVGAITGIPPEPTIGSPGADASAKTQTAPGRPDSDEAMFAPFRDFFIKLFNEPLRTEGEPPFDETNVDAVLAMLISSCVTARRAGYESRAPRFEEACPFCLESEPSASLRN
jgi:hypothetical protein